MQSTTSPATSQRDITRWLADQIARQTELSIDDLDIASPFSSFSLDSVAIVGLTADLEDWLQIPVPPTVVWDYPSIEQLARHLHAQLAAQGA